MDVLPYYGFKKSSRMNDYWVYEKEIFHLAFRKYQNDPYFTEFYFFVNKELVEIIQTRITKPLVLIKRVLKVIDTWKKIEILKDI
jgi:hypothetical protein